MARPRINFDLELIEQLCAKMATNDDLARMLGCSTRTLIRARQEREEVREAMERGWAAAHLSLRRAQMESALSGNTAMLIWLGKQYLGQSDRKQPAAEPEVSITMQRAMEELRNIPKDQLLAAQALLNAPRAEA